jgi:hypothetical protein
MKLICFSEISGYEYIENMLFPGKLMNKKG